MGAEVFEDSVELEIGLVEALQLEPDGGPEHAAAYPNVLLRPEAGKERRSFQTLILENAYLRATILPELGGRILSLYDKRIGKEILSPYEGATPTPGGPRGARLDLGVELWLGDEPRANAMGEVRALVGPPAEDDAPASIWLGEVVVGRPLSWTMRISLPADRAELEIETRIFNRSLEVVECAPRLVAQLGGGSGHHADEDGAIYDSERDVGLALHADEGVTGGVEVAGGALSWFRHAGKGRLAPRQLDSWTVKLTPFGGLGGLRGLSSEGVAHVEGDELRLQVVERKPGHKVVLLLADGQTLEAPADIYPETPLKLSLQGLPSPPWVIVLRDPAKVDVLRLDLQSPSEARQSWRVDEPDFELEYPHALNMAPERLSRLELHQPYKPLALTAAAMGSLGTGHYAAAAEKLEQALLHNGEDHLAWWAKAVAHRLVGEDEEERPELLNAHFLAPLEPALRAESFLAQPQSQGKEPNPIVAPLAASPDELLEVAHLLLEHGLMQEAARWIDESLRHVDIPLMRYLLAYGYLTRSRMETEAAEQVSAAARAPIAPPYPWRRLEREAVRLLAQRFPQDGRLGQLVSLLALWREEV
jgi:hypothetical protein